MRDNQKTPFILSYIQQIIISIIERAAHGSLSNVEPRRAVGEGQVDHLHPNAVRNRLPESSIRVVKERSHALAHAVSGSSAEVPNDVAAIQTQDRSMNVPYDAIA